MEKGFSLFELLVAMSIIAILSTIALPSFLSWRNGAMLRSAVFNVRSDLERAKSSALRYNADVKVVFTAQGYSVYYKTENTPPSEEWKPEFSRSFGAGSINMSQAVFGTNDYAVFNPRGMLSGSSGSVTITLGVETENISVDRTGRIRIS